MKHISRTSGGRIILAVALIAAGVVVYFNLGGASLCACGGGDQAQVAHVFVTDSIATPLMAYAHDTGSYPTTAQGLEALITAPAGVNNWHGPYITIDHPPKDPWGNFYNYACPGVHNPKGYDVWSPGPNGTNGKDSEIIGNW
jgi:general secretion pathway protein G